LDTVVEIGAGLGALTIPIAQAVAKVVAVEKDPQLCNLLRTELLAHNISNVVLLQDDFLRCDLERIIEDAQRPLIIMGNLPYRISTQVLLKLVAYQASIARAILMFQKELAERLKAGPGQKDYGRLTVMLGYYADIRPVAAVAARLFFPKPGIDSEVLEINFDRSSKEVARDEALFLGVVKAAFGRRRKTLKNAFTSSELKISADSALLVLRQAGIDHGRRAETLTVAEFVRLSNCLAELNDVKPPDRSIRSPASDIDKESTET
jgi:16S rRNA (adenine1518-N6/adenine1519-N6)-dimethyltransferase